MTQMIETMLPGEMWVGGTMPESLLEAFVFAFNTDGAAFVYRDATFFDVKIDTMRMRIGHVHGREPLHIQARLVRWGEFPSLETFCHDHGLAYKRFSHPHFDLHTRRNGEVVIKLSSMQVPSVYTADVFGSIVLPYDELKSLVTEGRAGEFVTRNDAVVRPIPPFILERGK